MRNSNMKIQKNNNKIKLITKTNKMKITKKHKTKIIKNNKINFILTIVMKNKYIKYLNLIDNVKTNQK